MLESNRSPKVSLRDMTTVGQLSYQCVQAVDGCTGLCRIREEPPHASLMAEWLERLPLDLEYRGERLPALALSVFLALLNAKRRTPSAEEAKKLLKCTTTCARSVAAFSTRTWSGTTWRPCAS